MTAAAPRLRLPEQEEHEHARERPADEAGGHGPAQEEGDGVEDGHDHARDDAAAVAERIGLPTLAEGVGLPAVAERIGLPTLAEGVGLPAVAEGIGRPAVAEGVGVARARRLPRSPFVRSSAYSHSIVPGGLLVMSSTTRLTSRISLIIREEIRSRRSYGSRAQSAVMASSEVTARTATT